ncbi:MAG: hypothetical protein JRH20_32460 [Deltaproteobacteria bacterium]|nr:hypothetical protein [Deltaproteobacteria bacterium]
MSYRFAAVLKALGELSPPGGQGAFSMHFAWSPSRPAPSHVRDSIALTAGAFVTLARAADSLRASTPSRGAELTGYVVKLTRETDGTKGDVEIVASDPEEGQIRVQTTLRPDHYAEAIRAHGDGLSVRVFGTLIKQGRRYKLDEPSGFELVEEPED